MRTPKSDARNEVIQKFTETISAFNRYMEEFSDREELMRLMGQGPALIEARYQFSPAYEIGALHAGLGSITWFSVTHEGHPKSVIDKPETGPIDIILYRLSQAYTSTLIASHPSNPPPWKA